MKFKSDIEVQAGLRDGSDDIGTAGQLLSSTGTITNWIDQSEVVAAGATRVLIACKNTSGGTLTKGTPVYQTGNVGATDVIEVAAADALISTGYLPAIGLLETDLINNALGNVVITGELLNITTDPIDGLTPTTGDTIYLKSGGGLTLTKPTGEGNAIQNLGLVGKVSGGNAGSITVASIMRQNDVPNLPTGKIWVGDGNTTVSDVVYLDEVNERMGIRTTSPIGAVHIIGPNTNPAMTTSSLVVEQSDGAKILIDGNDIDAAAGMLYLNDYSTNDVVFGGQIRVGGGGSPVGNSWFANGNVGIGTTSPSYKLDVSGDAYIDETLNIETTISGTLAYGYSGVGAGNLVVGGLNFASFTPAVITLMNQDTTISAGQDLGVLQFGGKDDTTNGYANGQIICTTAVGAGTGNSGGGIFRFLLSGSTTGSGPSEKMRITNTGNVGIGTTSPSTKLHVVGNSEITGDIFLGRYIFHDNDTNTWIGFPSNDTISFRTNGLDRVRVTSSGNVGIGTASPGEKLEVDGHIKAVDGYKGYVSHFHSGGFDHIPKSSDGANPFWIPSNYIVDATVNQYYNIWVPLYAGRIRKIIFKNTTGTPTATVCTFYKRINGTTSGTTYAGTVTGGGASGMKVTVDFGTSNFTFNAEDEIQIGFVTGVATQPPLRGVSYQIWYEYNIT